MNSFNTQLHSDEFDNNQPTEADYAEYAAFCEAEEAAHEAESYDCEYDGQPDEAQEWYDFDPDC